MNIEHHVVSLELAKELQANGYPQKTLFTYVQRYSDDETDYQIVETESLDSEDDDLLQFAAPLASEIGEELPDYFMTMKRPGSFVCRDFREYGDITSHQTEDTNEANTRAKMWIYLKANNLLPEKESV